MLRNNKLNIVVMHCTFLFYNMLMLKDYIREHLIYMTSKEKNSFTLSRHIENKMTKVKIHYYF